MITQELKTKEWELLKPPSEGFFITNSSVEQCYDELYRWCKDHPEKWVYTYYCGIVNGKYTIEIMISDEKIVYFMPPYQEGTKKNKKGEK